MSGGLRDGIVKSRDEWLWERYRRTREESGGGGGGGGSIGYGEGERERDGERDGEFNGLEGFSGMMGEKEMEELDGDGVDEVPNGLKRVEVWGEEVEIPRISGIVA